MRSLRLVFVAIFVLAVVPAWAGGSAAIVLEGPEFNAEAELAIRDALAPLGLTIESRDTIEAARAFASSGDAGWNEASLQSLRGAVGCNLLLVFEQKIIGGTKYALRAHAAFEGGVASKVMSTEKADLHKALARLTIDALGEVPRPKPKPVPSAVTREESARRSITQPPQPRARQPRPPPVVLPTPSDNDGLFMNVSLSFGFAYTAYMGSGIGMESFDANTVVWITAGMTGGLGAAIKSKKLLEGGDFSHQLDLGWLWEDYQGAGFIGFMLIGDYDRNISNVIDFDFHAMLDISDGWVLSLDMNVGYYLDADIMTTGGGIGVGYTF